MKVVYEPGEIEFLERMYKDYPYCFGHCSTDRTYAIKFNVTNPAIASYILVGLMNNNLEDFNIGIDIQSIEFDVSRLSLNEMKTKLHKIIDEL